MNTTKNAERMDKLRKSRSLNDVVSVIKNIAKDIGRNKNVVARMVATAATSKTKGRKVSTSSGPRAKPEKVRISYTGEGPDIEVPQQTPSGEEAKKANRATFTKRKPLSSGKKIENYVAPNVAASGKIQDKIDVIHDLHENLVELEAAQEKIKQQFRGAKNLAVALKGIDALKTEIEGTLNDAYELLNTIAEKHLPVPLQEMNDALQQFLTENLPANKYSDMNSTVYVTVKAPTDKDEGAVTRGVKKIKIDVNNADFAFHCYTILDNLENSEGFEFEEYCVVLTGLVDRKGVIHYFLNALPDFKAPGKFNIGQEVQDDDEMFNRMSMLLAHNDVITELERKPMPLTTKSAKEKGFHSIDGVAAVHVVDDTLRITVLKSKQNKVDEIKVEVRNLLRAVIGRRSKSKVLPRVAKDNKGNTVLVFSLVPDIPDTDEKKDYAINVSKLRDLQHVLGLPEDVIEDVRKAMLHRT